jgi:CHAT domain-containing protein/tetratricopeptide (TPR) repeat protein
MTRVLLIMAGVGLAGTLTMSSTYPQEPMSSDVTHLTEGLVLERDAAVGETHRYSIELHAGQYVQLLVEQRGADVAEILTAPDGGVLLETDNICGEIGPDPVAFIASTGGVYELRLNVLDMLPRGRYEIHVEAVRDPTPLDRLRVKAVNAGADGLRLAASEPAEAVDRFREAASTWHQLGDRRLQMWMEHWVGALLGDELGRLEEARDVTAHALATALALGDEWAEARLRLYLGFFQRKLGQFDAGKEELERALVLHRAAGVEAGAGHVLVALGASSLQAGEAQPGLEYLFEGLRSFQAAGTTLPEALTRSQIAIAFLHLRDPEQALEQCRLALPALVEEPSMIPGRAIAERATCLTTTGKAHLQLGDVARAREALSEALAIWKTVGRLSLAVEADIGLGDIHVAEGDLAAGRQVFAAALARTGDDPFLEGLVQCRLGDVELRLGNAKAARTAFEAALALAPRVGAWVNECAEAGLGRVARDTGDLAAARMHAGRALATAESVRAQLLSDRARSAMLASQQSRYELLIDVLMRQHEQEPSRGHDRTAFEMSERARARSLLELLAEGQVDVRSGVDPTLLAEERSLRRKLNATAHEEGEARDAGRNERADALAREVDGLVARLVETETRIRRISPQYAALTQPQPLNVGEIRTQVLDPETQLLQYALGETRSYLWVVSAERLESFPLAPRAEIERAARRVHELSSQPSGATRAGDQAAAARDLARLVLAPASGALTGKRLLVVAPGALQYVPFAALPLPDGTFAIARYEVVSAPSASVVATLRSEASRRTRGGKAAAVFADPVFEASDPRLAAARGRSKPVAVATASGGIAPPDPLERALRGVPRTGRAGGLTRLPFSRQEADAIASLGAGKQALKATGFEANREAATSPQLADYQIVHFATHGVLNTRQPDLSGVVLSLFDKEGQRRDGFLRLRDVYNLRLGADLVVLSGCQTGLGKDLRGEGLVGLTRGFMYAGARRVVASLWQVDDESTAELMKRFYRAMLKDGRRPSDALRVAQLEMSRDRRWSAPFYWAGFVLQGEWR